jgi:fimbrial chaperone protein
MLVPIAPAHSASSILIWPIDPVIAFKDHAAAIWVENEGKQPTLLQLRVFAWDQSPNENHYSAQSDIVGTPPMIRIEPGKRQLIRLTRTVDVPPGVERPFRVVIDEILTPVDSADNPVVGARLQMRYSIPLFVYGAGLSSPSAAPPAKKDMGEQPHLGWRVTTVNGAPYLTVSNTGPVHARLIKVAFQTGATTTEIASGLLGYVLPRSTMQWALPKGVQGGGTLTALVNGSETPQTIPAL